MLIKCPECGREISDKAECCIGCGYPIQKEQQGSAPVKSEPEFSWDEFYAKTGRNRVVYCPNCYEEYHITPNETHVFCIKCSKMFDCTPKPKCPVCGSENVQKISIGSKALGFATVGVLSSNFGKNMKCNNCGNKW